MAKKLMKGCEAVAEAAIQAGCHDFFGYPITPQNDIPEYMSKRQPSSGGRRASSRQRAKLLQSTWSTAQPLPDASVHDKLLQPRNQP